MKIQLKSNGIPTGQVVTITDRDTGAVLHTQAYDTLPLDFVFPYRVNYEVSVDKKTNYITPAPKDFTASQTAKPVTMNYTAIPKENSVVTLGITGGGGGTVAGRTVT
ncbi:hypothetical protein Barb6XT_00475 [Bacteroidales bacterium Barb6XT]|nr:hypothetical protein Barb6XT_00475 [Bacteroidales bacterium Barb6XT]